MTNEIGAKPAPDVIDLLRSGQHNLQGPVEDIEPAPLQMIIAHAISEVRELRKALYLVDGQRQHTHLYDNGRHIPS